MLNNKDILILNNLRTNSRITLNDISENTNLPITTVFERLKKLNKKININYVSLLDFSKINYLRIFMFVKTKDRDEFKKTLKENKNINSIFRVENNYDFLLDCIFKDRKELNFFLEKMGNLIIDKKIIHLIKSLKEEDFLFSNI